MRGYNQSGLLCERIIKDINIPYKKDILKRVVNNKSQTNLSREERMENVKGIFKVCEPEKINDKTILIIDDVLTTGATINECSKTLVENGAKEIIALTLAYTILT